LEIDAARILELTMEIAEQKGNRINGIPDIM
jgi:hypothetical protein